MSEYFIIHNISKKEYLSSQEISQSMNIEAVITGLTINLLGYLLTTKKSNELRFQGISNRYKGYWKGDKIEIIGDETDQNKCYKIMTTEKEVSQKVLREYNKSNIESNAEKIDRINAVLTI